MGLKADIALADSQIRSAEAAILQREAKTREIEIDLARTEIKSPVEGVVIKRDIELGQTVAASLSAPTLFTIAQDLREIDIYANIDEADVGRLKAGQKVAFTVNAYPNRSFDGVVRMVRLSAQTVQNVVTYTAVISVRNRDQALLPGMTANLQIVTDDREDVLRVPNAALRFRPAAAPNPPAIGSAAAEGLNPRRRNRGQDAPQAAGEGSEGRVYRVGQDGNPQPVPLRLGVTDGAFTEVLRGDLPEGATLVVGGGPRAGAAADANAPASGTRRPPRMF